MFKIIYDKYVELDEVFDKITNFEDNTLYVEMFPISDTLFTEYKEKLSEYENVYYFRFWEEVLMIQKSSEEWLLSGNQKLQFITFKRPR